MKFMCLSFSFLAKPATMVMIARRVGDVKRLVSIVDGLRDVVTCVAAVPVVEICRREERAR